ncbi:hypothetical protein [Telmatospirillum sp. J64-1]|uniref:hypothetical protein n=1 Tax=Telmatospirillum sp. J64-1 TaxID=2502183 RepID=UPI00115CBF5F|nr:hypothetical protein [Telmatospirillum sp. J64-1]
MRMLLSATLALALLAPAMVLAQPTDPQGLAEDPAVKESQGPNPNPQGIRSPEIQSPETEAPSLADALAAIRAAPPNLEGQGVPRPNEMASEPQALHDFRAPLVSEEDLSPTDGGNIRNMP